VATHVGDDTILARALPARGLADLLLLEDDEGGAVICRLNATSGFEIIDLCVSRSA